LEQTHLFSTLKLPEPMLANLQSMGYHTMTPIQKESLPPILAQKDLIAQAKTGSGKTAAFGIGLINKLNATRLQIQSVVMCPTRELAEQVSQEIRRLARFIPNVKVVSLCGGTPIRPQYASLEHGAHIIVGTPGRISDHLTKGSINLKGVRTLVLDEADRMLDMGFFDTIHDIIDQMPRQRQTLLFSATFPEEIGQISRKVQNAPVTVKVEALHSEEVIEQRFYLCDHKRKSDTLVHLLSLHQPASTLIFCNTKQLTQQIADDLSAKGFAALAMHGDLEQWEREKTLALFSNKSRSILVATDVAARGLDIADLAAVVNYELPRDPEIYVHRIGRTARAGKSGLALNLFTEKEQYRVATLSEHYGKPIPHDVIDLTSEVPVVTAPLPPMITLCINAGQKNKVRPGDILGALTAKGTLTRDHVGTIKIFNFHSFVAVRREVSHQALAILTQDTVKGRNFKAQIV
jgi:ATP-independent RNA helicase DbpA